MLASLYAKLAGLALVLAALAGLYLWGHHRGAAEVQAQWKLAKGVQAAAVDRQVASNAQQSLDWLQQFQSINARYEDVRHETMPAVADATADATAAGALRLRGESERPVCAGSVPLAAARARAADAAATQALADRVTAAIAAIRTGDDADTRERQLGQQLTALQALLQAERQRSPTP